MKVLRLILFAICLTATPALAEPFGKWREQGFPMRPANSWTQSPQRANVSSDAAASLIWTRTAHAQTNATTASWAWSVQTSVPATTLTQKGRDDRNLALFFVFLPPKLAEKHQTSGIQKLLSIKRARVLMYVWGGDYARGALIPSPHMKARGKIIALRPAGTGEFRENVNLTADFTRAFGTPKPTLAGLAILSDSDDSKTMIRANLSDLQLN